MDTRFAPSPSGHLHVGSARTALFAYLLARGSGGRFDLRVEDTDPTRSTAEYEGSIRESLEWLGLEWDRESRQSDADDRYRDALRRLEDAGAVYRDPATTEDILEWRRAHGMRGYRGTPSDAGAWRLRLGDGPLVVSDVVRGDWTVDLGTLDDPAVARADGSPMFLLANAVDDLEYPLVVRGHDLVALAPKQTLLRRLLGGGPIAWAHLPIILGEDGKKLSKRLETGLDLTVPALRDAGYLPGAVLATIAGLGWSGGADAPLALEALVERFRIEDVSATNAHFDPAKLRNANGLLLRDLPLDEYASRVASLAGWDPERSRLAASIARPRAQTLLEAVSLTEFLGGVDEYDQAAVERWMTDDGRTSLAAARDALAGVEEPLDAEAIEELLRTVADGLGLKPVVAFQPIRIALCGVAVGPAIHHAVWALGIPEAVRRIDRFSEATG